MNVAAVLLAAGGSTRLGSPKQLLVYRGKTLLRQAAETLLATACRPVVAVFGSEAARLRDEVDGLDVRPVLNPCWSRGMGTSVRVGIDGLDTFAPGADAALLMLCDQPLIGPEAVERLCDAFRRAGSPGAIAAAAYAGTVGVPAVFGRAHFADLRVLPDDAGAKPVLRRQRSSVIAVPMPEAATDIDTRAQYESLEEL